MAFRSMMLTDVPNFAFAIGYTNASWTLKVDLVAEHVCRLLARMDERGESICTVEPPGPDVQAVPILDFQAGYVLRAIEAFPRAGSIEPYCLRQNYLLDARTLRRGRLEDGLRFTRVQRSAGRQSSGSASPGERGCRE